MNKMNNIILRRFTSKMNVNNPYHHGFSIIDADYFTVKKFIFAAFDLMRIYFYIFVVLKVGMKAPQYLMFRRKNYLNNPDYMLINPSESRNKDPDFAKMEDKQALQTFLILWNRYNPVLVKKN